MCNYSLHNVASRPARVGDRLVTTEFQDSITRGFASPDELEVAVCLQPGTELAFDENISYGPGFGLFPPRLGYLTTQHRVAKFRQTDTGRTHVHHDALEFPNGEMVLVTRLREGLRATVLQLPSSGLSKPRAPAHETQPETAPSWLD